MGEWVSEVYGEFVKQLVSKPTSIWMSERMDEWVTKWVDECTNE